MNIEYLKDKKHIDLTPYFTSRGIDKEHVHIGFDGSLDINGETYYIKRPETEEKLLGELVAVKLLDKINLPHVQYYLGKYFDDVVLISKSFKKSSCNYIQGLTILDDYNETVPEPKDISDLNNLEDIWQALEYRYSKRKTPEQTLAIVSNLMEELTTLFSFDIVIGNTDRHQSNWVVEEGPDGINLATIYDNEYLLDAYLDSSHITTFSMTSSYEELCQAVSPEQTIENYIKISSEEFINKLQQIKENLSVTTFTSALNEVEHDFNENIPPKIKDKLISSYSKHQNLISNLISNYHSKSSSLK